MDDEFKLSRFEARILMDIEDIGSIVFVEKRTNQLTILYSKKTPRYVIDYINSMFR